MRRLPASVVAFALLATSAVAQPARPAQGADTGPAVQFIKARRLVDNGNAALGRALVDTLLAAATPGTPQYAEALYWRATFAERASDAERDYRRLAVEYASSPRAADALIRLAQLDLVRGQPATAREHLARLLRDHDDAPTRARAQYWLARAALDANDPKGACDALNAAAGNAEAGSDLARLVVAYRSSVPKCTLTVAIGGRDAGLGTRDSAPPSAPSAPSAPVAKAPDTRVPSPESRSGTRFTIQIAAYDSRAGAESLAARLATRGIDAHVEAGGATPDAGPFRVRVGRFATRAEAVAAQRDLKAKGLAGFIATSAAP